MKSIKPYHLLLPWLILMFSIAYGSFALYKEGLIYTAVFCFILCVFLSVRLLSFIRNTFLFYDKTIAAILNNDFSANFSKDGSFENHKNLFRLYETLKHKQNEQVSQDLVYRSILDNIETSVLILQKSENDWDIFLMNDYFSKHFLVPKVLKWHYLKNLLPSLCHIVEEKDFKEMKISLQIRVEKQDLQTFMLQTSKTKAYGREYYIILLDSIQKIIEKKEKEAWINLMKVISHELMNSITPIRSLTQNLNDIMQQDTLSKDDLEDIRQSIGTMIHRSDYLQNFIESYRKLSMLPSPEKEKTALRPLIENTLQSMNRLFETENITVHNLVPFNCRLFMDKLQIEQVLINLLTNSMHALQGKTKKNIAITSEIKNNRAFISISDNGNGIEKEIEGKIFLPFFTTRKDGAGIGLTLSKNIIEAHGGYLNYRIEDGETKFVICLIG